MTDRIEKTVEIKAPIERVWRALTDHREFGTWFRVKLDTPFQPGNPATGQITYPGFEHVTWQATIQRMDHPHLFSFTWHPYAVDPVTDYSKEPPTLVEFRLRPMEGGTQLTVTESGFEGIPEYRRAEALRMNEGGWGEQVGNIRGFVEG